MKFTNVNRNGVINETEMPDNFTLDEVLESFQDFIRACGYVITYNQRLVVEDTDSSDTDNSATDNSATDSSATDTKPEYEDKCTSYDFIVTELFELLDRTEETDEGRTFRPNVIRSCRGNDVVKIEHCLRALKANLKD
tara:strand:- start:411 stop:824 length:414 start_codon:yes stop_codon:yes gene_type:complete